MRGAAIRSAFASTQAIERGYTLRTEEENRGAQ